MIRVVAFERKPLLLDFSKGVIDERVIEAAVNAIGRYNEIRPDSYPQELFGGERNIHMGIDLFAPAGTPVYAFDEGEVSAFQYNEKPGDYGYTLVTAHQLEGKPLYALWGHLSATSLARKNVGQRFQKGEALATLGDRHENGGWIPHLHFQLSWQKPAIADMPGVVSAKDHAAALEKYPDPRLVLGPLY